MFNIEESDFATDLNLNESMSENGVSLERTKYKNNFHMKQRHL